MAGPLDRQLPVLQDGYDVVGSSIVEFDSESEAVIGVRRLPTALAEIWRAAVLEPDCSAGDDVALRHGRGPGGVQEVPSAEDYDMAVRALQAGARMTNLDDPATHCRAGAAMHRRRGGRRVLCGEWQLQRALLATGFIGRLAFQRNVVVRGGFGLAPWWLKMRIRHRSLQPMSPAAPLPA